MNILKNIQKSLAIFLGGAAAGTLITLINKWYALILLLVVTALLFGWPLLRSQMKKAKEG